MKILGIETSCDETTVCLIEADGAFDAGFQCKVLGNALLSQIAIHAPYGGVFPNLAKREHARNLVPLLDQVLQEAATSPGEYTDISVYRDELKEFLSREPELFELLQIFLEKRTRPDIDAIAVTHGP